MTFSSPRVFFLVHVLCHLVVGRIFALPLTSHEAQPLFLDRHSVLPLSLAPPCRTDTFFFAFSPLFFGLQIGVFPLVMVLFLFFTPSAPKLEHLFFAQAEHFFRGYPPLSAGSFLPFRVFFGFVPGYHQSQVTAVLPLAALHHATFPFSLTLLEWMLQDRWRFSSPFRSFLPV